MRGIRELRVGRETDPDQFPRTEPDGFSTTPCHAKTRKEEGFFVLMRKFRFLPLLFDITAWI